MNNYEDNNAFAFSADQNDSFDYNKLSGLGESDYENEDLFTTELEEHDSTAIFNSLPTENYVNEEVSNNNPLNQQDINEDFLNDSIEEESKEEKTNVNNSPFNIVFPEKVTQDSYNNFGPVLTENEEADNEQLVEPISNDLSLEEPVVEYNQEINNFEEAPVENFESTPELYTAELEDEDDESDEDIVFSQGLEDDFDLPIVESRIKNNVETTTVENNESNKSVFENNSANIMSDTPIEELNKLTEYKKEDISSTDIKSLFARVGVNVKEASDIFMKNTEMKEKIDTRFEELKKLQSEVEKAKKSQYDEINAYKQEVFDKLTEKKDQIEIRINKLKDFQAELEKEKEEFEKFRKTEKEEIERVQKEIQDAYDNRREELSHIEDVLRRQKDSLDEERSQLSLDRIQYESDKNELANNLLKFNEIVDSFTNGMDKAGKE